MTKQEEEDIDETSEETEVVVEKPKVVVPKVPIGWFRWPAFLNPNNFGKWKWVSGGGNSRTRPRAAGRGR